jgi:hypothetical protein
MTFLLLKAASGRINRVLRIHLTVITLLHHESNRHVSDLPAAATRDALTKPANDDAVAQPMVSENAVF